MTKPKMPSPKILFFDVETTPNLAYVWELYEANALEVKENWSLLSFAYRWQGDPSGRVSCASLRHFKGSTAQKEKALVRALHKLLNKADILIAHNGDEFDVKKAKARFIYHNFKPLKPIPTVDTLKVAKKYFKFSSNRLDSLGAYLGLGRKVETSGFSLWLGCMANKKKAWKKLEEYNKKDVVLLEKVYNRLRPWMHTHPSSASISGHRGCNTTKRGTVPTNTGLKQRLYCKDCKVWYNRTI